MQVGAQRGTGWCTETVPHSVRYIRLTTEHLSSYKSYKPTAMHSTRAHACGHRHNAGASRYSSGGVELLNQIVTHATQMMMELLQKATLCGIKAVVSVEGQGAIKVT